MKTVFASVANADPSTKVMLIIGRTTRYIRILGFRSNGWNEQGEWSVLASHKGMQRKGQWLDDGKQRQEKVEKKYSCH